MKTHVKRMIQWLTVLVASSCFVGMASGATVAEWLFDSGLTNDVAINEVPGGDQPRMQQPGVAFTNLHALGGPFSNSVPYHSIGMMSTPASGQFVALKTSGFVLDWTTMSQFTIEMWINPNTTVTPEDPLNLRGQGMRLTYNNGFFLQAYLNNGAGGGPTPFTSAKVFPNVWSHIAMTYDGTTLRTYVNGVPDASKVIGLAPTNAAGTQMTIGGYSSASNPFHGGIDEIRVSNVALLPGDGSGKGVLAWNATLVPEPTAGAFLSVAGAMLFFRRRDR